MARAKPAPPKAKRPATERRRVPDPQTFVSPFLQSHPWAAPPGGLVYYRSTCEAVLEFTDLLYFTSEAQAQALGFVPSRVPGCH